MGRDRGQSGPGLGAFSRSQVNNFVDSKHEAEVPLRERLSDPRVAFVNIHTARPGCWLTRVERG